MLSGGKVTFTCQATGDGDITYLWQHVDSASELDLSRTSGINSNELIISNISPDDAGSYVCIASNKNRKTESNKAILHVQGLCISFYYCKTWLILFLQFSALLMCRSIMDMQSSANMGNLLLFIATVDTDLLEHL